MAGLLTTSSMMMCPHGGEVQAITTNTRTKAGGDFALRQSDTFIIAACPFILGLVPHPCVQVQWVQPALQSQAVGDFTVIEHGVEPGEHVVVDGQSRLVPGAKVDAKEQATPVASRPTSGIDE